MLREIIAAVVVEKLLPTPFFGWQWVGSKITSANPKFLHINVLSAVPPKGWQHLPSLAPLPPPANTFIVTEELRALAAFREGLL